jgi:hypothetical protein
MPSCACERAQAPSASPAASTHSAHARLTVASAAGCAGAGSPSVSAAKASTATCCRSSTPSSGSALPARSSAGRAGVARRRSHVRHARSESRLLPAMLIANSENMTSAPRAACAAPAPWPPSAAP